MLDAVPKITEYLLKSCFWENAFV